MLSPNERKQVERLIEFESHGIANFEYVAPLLGEIITPDNYAAISEFVPTTWKDRLAECVAARAQQLTDSECLEPEDSPFESAETHGQYYRDVSERLFTSPAASSTHYRLSVVCLPSFDVEWAVRLLWPKRDDPSLVLTVAAYKIWREESDTALNASVLLHRAPITAELAEQIGRIWDHMLRRTRFPQNGGLGLDGVTYHFANRWMAGKKWSPQPDTAPGRLVELSHRLRDYCEADADRRPALLGQVQQMTREFLPSG